MIWKAKADEKRAIRSFAARGERRRPQSIKIEVGEREPDSGGAPSTNVLLVGGVDNSDLHQPLPWSELDRGIDLDSAGMAIVDFYVYERAFDDHGDLLTNVQAHVKTINGKPMIVRLSGTGVPDATGEALWAFHLPPAAQKDTGTTAYYALNEWDTYRPGGANNPLSIAR